MKTAYYIVIAGLLVLHVSSALALMPPMSEKELKERSNTIVMGHVTLVKKTGEFIKGRCADKTGKIATLMVDKTIKGSPPKEFKIHFFDYNFKEGCVGSPDRVHYKGEKGKYYLKCIESKCRLTHWNGFEKEK